MFAIIGLAGLVVLYVAYPHRGEESRTRPWVGDAMRKGVDALPTLDNQPTSSSTTPPPAETRRRGRPTRCPVRAGPVLIGYPRG